LGSAGIGIVHLGLSGTSMVKAMCRPSGDQRASAIRSTARVIWLGGPSASTQRTLICGRAAASSAMYSTRRLSGDQRAPAPLAKKRLRVPSASTIHSAGSHLSSKRLTCWRV
jgi:hypothetical protein